MIGIILQARMGSTRLPGKVMRELCGQPMLGHILDRLKKVRGAARVIVATSIDRRDDVIESFAVKAGMLCFRGSETDVLDRYLQAARKFNLDTIVRATADNPFLDPEEIDRLIDVHISSKSGFSSALARLPLGVGCECFDLTTLSTCWSEGHEPHHREHVDEYALENPLRFRALSVLVPSTKCAPQVRLTVDTPEDFAKATKIYQSLYKHGEIIPTEKVITLCASLSA